MTTAMPLILLTAAFTLCYGLACWIWPFRRCHRCHGMGRTASPSGRAFRPCRPCKATGMRLRFGRWVWNFYRRLHGDAHR